MTVPDTKVTHHEPPTCPAFLLSQDLYAALRTVVASAFPHPQTHPSMSEAWRIANEALARAEGTAV